MSPRIRRLCDPRRFADDRALPREIEDHVAKAAADAVRSVEACSCAELVVEVRDRSGSYAHADTRFAALVALFTLAFALFSPYVFARGWVMVDVLIGFALGLLI